MEPELLLAELRILYLSFLQLKTELGRAGAEADSSSPRVRKNRKWVLISFVPGLLSMLWNAYSEIHGTMAETVILQTSK